MAVRCLVSVALALTASLAVLTHTPETSAAQTTTLSGGVDLRAGLEADPDVEVLTGLSSVFVNLRTVYDDDAGDRVFLVAQADVEEEIERSHLYNVYVQYKGPLGRWNVRVGRYLVPFGLHYYYDTERLLLPAHEAEALGLKLDDGGQVFGFRGAFDYSVSVSRGFRNRPTPIVRLGWQGEESRAGLSYLFGKLPSIADQESVELDELRPDAELVPKHRLAIDYERTLGVWTLRTEPLAGADDGKLVVGGFAEVGRALSARWELVGNGAILHTDMVGTRWRTGASVSYRIVPSVFARGAYQYRNGPEDDAHLVVGQIYAEFSDTLGGE